MVRGAKARLRRGQGGGLLRLSPLLFALWLAGCAASSEDGGGGLPGVGSGSWVYGGQTGSLMPVCGLAPAAGASGVPASVSGFVVDTRACADGASTFTLRDSEGQAVPFTTQPLGDGTLFVTPASGLTPGTYVLERDPTGDAGGDADADGGVDGDAGGAVFVAKDAAAPSAVGDTLVVVPATAPPLRLGTLAQVAGACVATFELTLDPSIVPYASQLALELQVDRGPPRRLVEFGALAVQDGVVSLGLPQDVVVGLGGAFRELTVSAVVAGGAAAIEPARLAVACTQPRMDGGGQRDEASSGCALTSAASRRRSADPWLLAALALLALRRRRRRPPD